MMQIQSERDSLFLHLTPWRAEYADKHKGGGGNAEIQNINVKQKKTSNKKEHFVYMHGWQRFACQKLNAHRSLQAGWQEQISSCTFRMLKGWNSAEISLTKQDRTPACH